MSAETTAFANAFANLLEPQLEMERLVLAAVIHDPFWVSVVAQRLRVADFTVEVHRRIFEGMMGMHADGQDVDYMALAARIEAQHGPQEYLGDRILLHLTSLDSLMPVRSSRDAYLEAVLERACRAQLVDLSKMLDAAARGADNPLTKGLPSAPKARNLADAALLELGQIVGRANERDSVSLEAALDEAAADWLHREQLEGDDADLVGVPFGYRDLDDLTLGMAPADLVILGGRPGSGKTAMAAAVGLHNAMRGRKVLFFSLEMTRLAITQRLLAQVASIALRKIRLGRMSADESERLANAYQRIREGRLHIDQTDEITVAGMVNEARRFAAAQGGIDLIIVDYLQAIEPTADRRFRSEYEIVTQVTKELKLRLCKRLGIPVLALCALKKGNTEPTIEDLKGTGEIASRADLVVMLDRPETRSPDQALKGLGVAMVEKSRNDAMGRVELGFDGPTMRWRSLAPPVAIAGQQEGFAW